MIDEIKDDPIVKMSKFEFRHLVAKVLSFFNSKKTPLNLYRVVECSKKDS